MKVKPAATTPTPDTPGPDTPDTPDTNEGLTTAEVTNAIEGYDNTVLVSNNAGIKIHYAKDGKAVPGVSLVLSITPNDRATNPNYEIKGNASAVTDSNGNAVFTVGHKDAVKSDDTNAVAGFNYSVKTVSDGVELTKGELEFAAITVKDVKKTAPGDLKLSSNIGSTFPANGGVARTRNTVTSSSTTRDEGCVIEYVYSQQVSKEGTDGNKVTFEGGVAEIVRPSKEAAAKTGTQNVGWSTNKYHTYAGSEAVHYEKLEVDPTELDYATLNFKNIQISEHTRLRISAHRSEADAKTYTNPLNISGNAANPDKIIDGPSAQANFGYQIPFRNLGVSEVYFRVAVESAGRVNTDANAGFDWTNITYVYKSLVNTKNEVYKNATVEWSKVDKTMSEPKVLDVTKADDAAVIRILEASNSNVKLQGTKRASDGTIIKIEKVIYQVPVFPYTGNAVIKTYDKNNAVIDYYVYPTVNSSRLFGWNAAGVLVTRPWDVNGNTNSANENMLPFTRDVTTGTITAWNGNYACYQISADEADNSVGTVTNNAENHTVTVNSEKTGYSLLKGELKVNGQPISSVLKGFDDANSTVYTSVQWNPIRESKDNTGFIALKGQTITVTAQLKDQNGNPVAQSGLGVRFSQNGNNLEVGKKVVIRRADGTILSDAATVIKNETVTDIHGQAKLVLGAGETATVLGITAEPEANRQYTATVGVGGDNISAESADLYWIDADLSFRSAVQADGVEVNTITNDIETTNNKVAVTPKSGEKWEYGVQVIGTSVGGSRTLVGGVWDGKTVTVTDLPVDIKKAADSVGTVTPVTGRYGAADVTSRQRGIMDVINAILPQDLGSSVKFTLSGVADPLNNAGTGLTTINKRLTIRAVWDANGQGISIFRAGGNNVAVAPAGRTAAKTPVYVRITDAYGNYIDGKRVKVSVVNGSIDADSPALNIPGVTPITVPSGSAIIEASNLVTSTEGSVDDKAAYQEGLVELRVNAESAATDYTTITVTDMESNQTAAYTIHWTVPSTIDKFQLSVNTSGDNGSMYVSRYESGKVILTFNQDIVEDTFKIGAFKVLYGGKEYKIDSIGFEGRRQITLNVSELAKVGVNITDDIEVQIKPVNIAGVTYVPTSLNGESIDPYATGSESTNITKIMVSPSKRPTVTLSDNSAY